MTCVLCMHAAPTGPTALAVFGLSLWRFVHHLRACSLVACTPLQSFPLSLSLQSGALPRTLYVVSLNECRCRMSVQTPLRNSRAWLTTSSVLGHLHAPRSTTARAQLHGCKHPDVEGGPQHVLLLQQQRTHPQTHTHLSRYSSSHSTACRSKWLVGSCAHANRSLMQTIERQRRQ